MEGSKHSKLDQIVTNTASSGGDASASNQVIGNASLSSIDSKITSCDTGAVVVSSGAITETNSSVISIGIQDDGKVVVIGNFTSYNNIRKNRIIRLESSNGLSVNDNEINFVNIFPNPAKHAITVNLKKGYQLKKITIQFMADFKL